MDEDQYPTEQEPLDQDLDLGLEPEVDLEDDEQVTDPVGEPDVQAQQPQRSHSPSDRVRRAVNEAKEAKEEIARVRHEMQELLGRVSQPREDPDIERRRLENMSDYERNDYLREKDKNEFRVQLAQIKFEQEVEKDGREFDKFSSSLPQQFKKYSHQVEERFSELLKQGRAQPRKAILEKLIGEQVLAKGGKALASAVKEGQENIRRQTTRPTNARSTVSGDASPRNGASERLKRYHDQGGFL